MKNIGIFLTAYIFLHLMSFAQLRAQIFHVPNGIKFAANRQQIEITFFSGNIVKVVKCPSSPSQQIGNLDGQLNLMIKENVPLKFRSSDDIYQVESDYLKIEANLSNGLISFFDRKGRRLVAELASGFGVATFEWRRI